jgi:NAD(P)-dependent dehydrogenase (short-subunit alcohol dehydrogenase family)
MKLRNKIAIITGAGQGIGLAMGERFSAEGAHVVVAEIDRALVHNAAERITAAGTEALAYPIDVGDTDAVGRMIAEVVARYGRLDILVNNAGHSERVSFLDMTPDQWDFLQRVNQRAVFFAMQTAARQMIAQMPDEVRAAGRAERSYGKIVNLSSIAGRRGRADALHYSVSKAAVITMTQGAAMALAPYNINVNAICPSVVPTAMWDKLDREWGPQLGYPPGGFYKARVEKVPLKRAGTVQEIAAMATFLCSDDGDYITGQTYNVDGGSELN